MWRQGLVTDQVSSHVLMEQHLPLRYQLLLTPCAFCLPCPVVARPRHLSCPGFFLFSSHFIHLFLIGVQLVCNVVLVSSVQQHESALCYASLGGSDSKESICNAGDLDSIPGSGRSTGEGNANPLQASCLENPMDRGAWCRLQSMGSQRVRHNWITNTQHAYIPSLLSLSLTPHLHPTPLSHHRAKLPVLYSSFPVAICFTHNSVCFGEGNGTPLQYSCLENPMDGGAW